MKCIFRLRRDQAAHVALIGSFNNWSTNSMPMQQSEDRWEIAVDLAPGQHRYAYFVVENEHGPTVKTGILCHGSSVDVPSRQDERPTTALLN